MITKHLIAWFGIAFLAVLNGAARDLLYRPFTGELAAHQISTAALFAVIGGAAWLAQARWPLPSPRGALAVGGCWAVMTIAFECFAGRVLAGKPWESVLAEYDVSAGRVWALIPLWLAIVPALVFRARASARRAAP